MIKGRAMVRMKKKQQIIIIMKRSSISTRESRTKKMKKKRFANSPYTLEGCNNSDDPVLMDGWIDAPLSFSKFVFYLKYIALFY